MPETSIGLLERLNDRTDPDAWRRLVDFYTPLIAEWLHRKVRTELWGYARDEALDVEALVKEQYRGIRPALGYPACPDHTLTGTLFRILDAEKQGIHLTESFAMTPAASVSTSGSSAVDQRQRSCHWCAVRSM